ncbi:GNAT family N-acetyltransferase [Alkalihalophilus pseudofirmus]|uniref:GNAT family N-acetyltransferase n=1 Tax=Alkalihalophilus pseudofirmus TaxID=79885 RepID=UPI00259B1887|nr:GNAT family N-acetyltransferase [Alkalihalophilus pseudofirmus]WEG15251.1 GNAT family N-acetyltransferase [Alkalihalophilus pseudofirmus]
MEDHNIYIRKMTQEDFSIMAKWLSTNEVLEYYGDVNAPFSFEQVKQKYEPRVQGEVNVPPFIVEWQGTPIGFMQYYKLAEDKYNEFGYGRSLKVYGMDQFIGEPALFNKGIGTLMVSFFVRKIVKDTGADTVIVDPAISNVRAIKCYEKCGFRKVKQINEGREWLMEVKCN